MPRWPEIRHGIGRNSVNQLSVDKPRHHPGAAIGQGTGLGVEGHPLGVIVCRLSIDELLEQTIIDGLVG